MLLNIKNPASLIALIASLFITILILRPIDSFDIWWHLNSGLWMLDNNHILDYDVWSFTQANNEWLNLAWLFQIILAIFHSIGGISALFILKGLILFCIFLLISSPLKTKEQYAALFISVLFLLPGIYGHLHLRPHLAELLGLVSIVLITQGYLSKKKAIFCFFILLIWANIHASVVVAASALAVQFMFGSWNENIDKRSRLIISLLFLITPLLTPYGFKIINVLFSHGGSDFIKYYVSEWLPHEVYPFVIWVSLIIVSYSFIKKKINLSITEIFLLLFFFYYSLKHQRFELELCVLLIRPLTTSLSVGLNTLKLQNQKYPVLLSILLIVIHGVIYSGHIQSLSPHKFKKAPFDSFQYPSATIAQLNILSGKLSRQIKIINDYNFGGYISLNTKENVKVFIDSRMSTIFPESLLLPPYESDPFILKALAERYQVDAILLKLDNSNVLPVDDQDWQIVAYDSSSILFVRRKLANSINMPNIGYDPGKYSNQYSLNEVFTNIESTEKLLKLEPDNPVALNHMAIFLTNNIASDRDSMKVFDVLENSITLNPNDIFSRATYAFLAATNQQGPIINLFFKYLPDADELNTGINLSYDLTYAQLLINKNLPEIAQDYLYPDDKERRYRIDKIINTWKLRTISHLQLNEMKKAKNCLEIAYELTTSNNASDLQELDKLKSQISL